LLLALLLAVGPVPPDVAQKLVGGALTSGVAYARLQELTDTVGARLSGSPGAAAAVQWAVKKFQQDGLAARTEAVKVPHWVRGEETAEILASPGSVGHRLAVTALGNSIGGSATAEVIEARSVAEIASLGAGVRSSSSITPCPLPRTTGSSSRCGPMVLPRPAGPARSRC